MIDTKELRRGNFVYIHLPDETEQIVVSEIGEDYIRDHNGVVCYSIEPIHLTEEWLLKFGCEKKAEVFYKARFKIYQPVNWVNYMFCEGSLILREVKFVHTFQNLYFALTGEELK